MENRDGFFKHNNYHVVEISKDSVIIEAVLTDSAMNPYGIAHGGFIFGLGDEAMGLLAYNNHQVVTLDSSISYLAPGKGNKLYAKAEIVQAKHKMAFLKATIYNDKNELIATMSGTYYYIN